MKRKTRINWPLCTAIFESRRKQGDIAISAKIHPSTLSQICNGYLEANDGQKSRLAMVLKKKKDQLFNE
jgi:hypothetical protein